MTGLVYHIATKTKHGLHPRSQISTFDLDQGHKLTWQSVLAAQSTGCQSAEWPGQTARLHLTTSIQITLFRCHRSRPCFTCCSFFIWALMLVLPSVVIDSRFVPKSPLAWSSNFMKVSFSAMVDDVVSAVWTLEL